jgi:hypothetical protein
MEDIRTAPRAQHDGTTELAPFYDLSLKMMGFRVLRFQLFMRMLLKPVPSAGRAPALVPLL